MSELRSGKAEILPYSLSRWTDLPAAKWEWFSQRLDDGWFLGFDPRTALPAKWSLKPEDTLGLVFWTREPTNLIADADRLKDFPLVIHFTLTGWHEVEKGAPDLERGLFLLDRLVSTFGPDKVIWRFSPIPLVDDAVERFQRIAEVAEGLGLKEVFVSFLQTNDLMIETRHSRVRSEMVKQMASKTGIKVLVCNEDTTTATGGPPNLAHGVCEDGTRFTHPNWGPTPKLAGVNIPPVEGCGCALAVEPFTINETCVFGCSYCYAADKSLAPKKHNTTRRRLPIV